MSSQPASATMLRPGSTIRRAGSGRCGRTAAASSRGRPGEAATDVDPLNPELLCEPGQQLRKPGEGPEVVDVGADMRPDRIQAPPRSIQRASRGVHLVEGDSELRFRRAGGEVRVGVGGDAGVDPDPDPAVGGAEQRIERAERLGVDEGAAVERAREVGVRLADSIDNDPPWVGAGPEGERELDRPHDLEAEPVVGKPPQERRVGVRLDRICHEGARQGIAPRAVRERRRGRGR